jgi:hypothetical protein
MFNDGNFRTQVNGHNYKKHSDENLMLNTK